MKNAVDLDVVICTYNNAAMLDRVLEQLSRQNPTEDVVWRTLVVNNNSSDETLSVVEKHISRSPLGNIAVCTEQQQGLTPARLCGVMNTTAEWIAFVDDDCLLSENWIEEAARFAAAHPDCGAFGGAVILDWETPPPDFVRPFGWALAQQDHGAVAKKVECLVGAGMVVSRSALATCGWIDRQLLEDRIGTKLVSGGDVEMALRIRATGRELWYTPALTLRHVIPARRMTLRYLAAVTRGLGVSHTLADALTWPGSYVHWLQTAAGRLMGASRALARQAIRALLRRRPSKEVAIEASFLRGQWEGFSRILAMAPRRRRELLGRAANRLQPDPATFSDLVSPEGYHSLSSGGEESTGSPAASRRGASP